MHFCIKKSITLHGSYMEEREEEKISEMHQPSRCPCRGPRKYYLFLSDIRTTWDASAVAAQAIKSAEVTLWWNAYPTHFFFLFFFLQLPWRIPTVFRRLRVYYSREVVGTCGVKPRRRKILWEKLERPMVQAAATWGRGLQYRAHSPCSSGSFSKCDIYSESLKVPDRSPTRI